MAEDQQFGFEEEFTCSVCLEILRDPVSIPCGHNFCLTCLKGYWDMSRVCSCPQCRRTFAPRPELSRNTVLNEAIKKLKTTGFGSPRSRNYGSSRDVTCDACTGKKFRAVKSCLTCMASFCQRHLQPHFEGDALKHHKLVDSDRNLKEKLCAKHQRSLEIFCKTDETCICTMCVVTKHSGHKMVELETERGQKQKQLGATMSEIRRRLQEKKKTLKEIRRAVKQMKISVDKEVEENEKSFIDLIHCIEEAHRKLTERIREHEKREMEKAEGVTEQLETEIEELKRRDAELKELSETKDHVQFLQNFSSLCVLPTDGDSLITTVTTDFSSEELRKELSCLKKSLEKIGQWDIMPLSLSGHEASVFILQPPEPQSREEFLQYSCPLTLDINTAHRELRLSEGDKKVTRERTDAGYLDHPDRFDWYSQVLCREALTGTRSYWEVECAGDYVKIGVAGKGMRRKGDGDECGLGNNDKSWTLQWSHSKYFAYYNNKGTVINAPFSPRIGVYLDDTAGSLSFYDVAHKMTLLHRFNACFTEPLYPGFWLDCDSSVTICHLTQVDH